MLPTETLKGCALCGKEASPHWEAIGIWKCSSCGLLFRNPLPSQEDLAQLYKTSWINPLESMNETGSTDIQLAKKYASELARSLKVKNFRGMKVLDFGAGKGSMSDALFKLGADVYAVEPFGYEELKKQGFNAFRTLEEITGEVSFNGVVAIEVLEHLTTPRLYLNLFKQKIVRCGWIYISTPNARSFNALINRSQWREVLKAGHLMLYTSRSLQFLLSSCGFQEYRRLRWFINYQKSMVQSFTHYILQTLGLDGSLRYLAIKS
jgi:hypothetical protein